MHYYLASLQPFGALVACTLPPLPLVLLFGLTGAALALLCFVAVNAFDYPQIVVLAWLFVVGTPWDFLLLPCFYIIFDAS